MEGPRKQTSMSRVVCEPALKLHFYWEDCRNGKAKVRTVRVRPHFDVIFFQGNEVWYWFPKEKRLMYDF